MSLEWINENPPHWDDDKRAIVGGAPEGAFELKAYSEGDVMPGEWWRVEESGQVLGYGWMDTTWGDAEVLLAVDAAAQGRGIGTFILERLEGEAASRGLNYLFNVVSPGHPDADGVTRWLQARGFVPSHEDRLLRRPVRVDRPR